MIEACYRVPCAQMCSGPWRFSPGEPCGRWAAYLVDGTAYCWQHAKPLVAGREAELAAANAAYAELVEDDRQRRIAESTPGVIYAIQPYGATPAPLKIGFAGSLDAVNGRLAGLQVGSWHSLEIVGLRGGTVGIEHEIHRHLREHRIRGEWFWPHPDVMRVYHQMTTAVAA